MLRYLLVACAIACCSCATMCPAQTNPPVDFARDIRPILSDKCFACHGPDSEHREGGFRLDVKQSAMSEADSGERAIVPGDVAASELVRRIISDDESERMPPDETNKKITAEERELIVRWIQQGAPWREHWSFVPPQRRERPGVQQQSWPSNTIDYYILEQLEARGLTPAARADKVTLLRRLTLDLTGLPPSLEEVDAFLADDSPQAYERVVDRLLSSSRYGEHMARFWLDAARYGDTHGLHLDNYREMWPYRDWVVRAFNDNLPFDQFIIAQLAGDLLPDPTTDQLVATGFNRCHVTTNEGGSITEEVFVRNVVDRVVTTGTVFMGMTLECTRCHDHKYDPVTMQDFYSLFAYFNSIDGGPLDGNKKDPAPVIRVPDTQQRQKLNEFDQRIARLNQKLRGPWPQLDAAQSAWEREVIATIADQPKAHMPEGVGPDGNPQEQPPRPFHASPTISLGPWYWVGPFTDNRRYLVRRKHGPEGKPVSLDARFQVAGGDVSWTKRTDWVDGKLHTDLPGATAANFLYRKIVVDRPITLPISLGSDDGIKVFLNNKQVLSKVEPRALAADQNTVQLKLKQGENHLLMKVMNLGGAAGFYFALKTHQATLPDEITRLVNTAADARSAKQLRQLQEYFRNQIAGSAEFDRLRDQVAELRKQRAGIDRKVPTSLIFKEADKPREAFMLKRGQYDQPAEAVTRRTPGFLPDMDPSLPQNRLGLARWLVDPAHPLTARVNVNRFWQQFFGTGIVKTAEDFGSQGDPPSHPDLLDQLAIDFVESGWDVRALIKQVVMSSTYRQASQLTSKKAQLDPANRLMSRGPRFRMDAEMLRDQALFVSDLLVEQVGGPSVKPPQPDGLWFAVGYSGSNTVRFVGDQGPDKIHRRTLYTFIKRTAPPPQMSIIDAPSREACTVRRERTNTPLQALLLMNDPQYFEAAQALARRTLRESEDGDEQRAAHMFRLCTSRHSGQWELKELLADFQDHLQEFQANPKAAQRVAGGRPPADIDAAALAAWTMVANLILNLDEVVNKN